MKTNILLSIYLLVLKITVVSVIFRVGKNKLHEIRRVQLKKKDFLPNLWNFSAKFGSLNVQIRNNFKNIIFIACKWSKICNYYVNSMVISCNICQKEEKNAHGLNIWLTLVCHNLKFVVFYALFPPNLNSQNFRVKKKMVLSKSGDNIHLLLIV